MPSDLGDGDAVVLSADDLERESSDDSFNPETSDETEPDSAWWDPELHRLLEQVIELTPEARRQYLGEHAPSRELAELVESMIDGESAPVTLLDKGIFRTRADFRSGDSTTFSRTQNFRREGRRVGRRRVGEPPRGKRTRPKQRRRH